MVPLCGRFSDRARARGRINTGACPQPPIPGSDVDSVRQAGGATRKRAQMTSREDTGASIHSVPYGTIILNYSGFILLDNFIQSCIVPSHCCHSCGHCCVEECQWLMFVQRLVNHAIGPFPHMRPTFPQPLPLTDAAHSAYVVLKTVLQNMVNC